MDELNYWQDSGFVTLTYDDEHLPSDGSISKRDLQLFFKRLRKHYGKPIKYFACGEYGDRNKTFRPHYHAIIFGLGRSNSEYRRDINKWLSPDISASWTFGHHQVDTVTYESCRYVTDYVLKKYNGDKAKEEYGEKTVPFRLCSQGLGKRFVEDNMLQLVQNQGRTFRGKHVGLARYYLKKIDESMRARAVEEFERSGNDMTAPRNENFHQLCVFEDNRKQRAKERDDEIFAEYGDYLTRHEEGADFDDYEAWLNNKRASREKNLEARSRNKK